MSNCKSCKKKIGFLSDNGEYCDSCYNKIIKTLKHPLSFKEFYYKYFYWILPPAILNTLSYARANNMNFYNAGGLGEVFGTFIGIFMVWLVILVVIDSIYQLYWLIKMI
jgi:polyferredoxin